MSISYAREDAASVQKVHQNLKRVGHEPWMDIVDIHPGEQWEIAIENSLEKADLCIVFLSKTSVKKRSFIQVEFGKILELAKRRLLTDIFIIPIRLDDCEMLSQFKKYNYLDLFEDEAWDKFIAAVAESQKRMEDL